MRRMNIKEEMKELKDEITNMVDEVVNTVDQTRHRHSKQSSYRRPKTEIIEEDDQYNITVELPGVNKENISLKVTGRTLSVTVDQEEQDTRQQRSYYRQIRLPANVSADEITASYSNGILDINATKETADDAQEIQIS